jgi:hypothetical protein
LNGSDFITCASDFLFNVWIEKFWMSRPVQCKFVSVTPPGRSVLDPYPLKSLVLARVRSHFFKWNFHTRLAITRYPLPPAPLSPVIHTHLTRPDLLQTRPDSLPVPDRINPWYSDGWPMKPGPHTHETRIRPVIPERVFFARPKNPNWIMDFVSN